MTVCAPRKGEKGMEQGLGVRTKCSSIFFPVFILKKEKLAIVPMVQMSLLYYPLCVPALKKKEVFALKKPTF